MSLIWVEIVHWPYTVCVCVCSQVKRCFDLGWANFGLMLTTRVFLLTEYAAHLWTKPQATHRISTNYQKITQQKTYTAAMYMQPSVILLCGAQ